MTTAIYGNSLYTIVEEETWDAAESSSISLGGHLVTINTGDENTWLHDAFSINPTPDSIANPLTEPNWLYTGFNDVENEGQWVWSSGQPVTYTNWWDETWSSDPPPPPFPNYNENYMHLGFIPPDKWNDTSNNGTVQNRGGIAEIPLNLSVGLPETVEEGTEFTVDINLTAGTSGTDLTQRITIWYTYEITGVDGNGEPDAYSFTGSGQIDANGQFDDEVGVAGLQVTIDKDWVFDDDQFRLTFYSEDPSGTGSELGFTDPAAYRDAIQIDVDQAEGGEIIDGVVVADILGIPDPITGIFDGPGTVNLNNKGVTPFTLFGSDELNVEAIKVDSLVFGGEDSTIGVAEKKNGTLFAAYEDVNGDEFLDLVVKVETSAFAFAGVAPTEPFEVFGSLTDETTQVVFGLNEGDSINFI